MISREVLETYLKEQIAYFRASEDAARAGGDHSSSQMDHAAGFALEGVLSKLTLFEFQTSINQIEKSIAERQKDIA